MTSKWEPFVTSHLSAVMLAVMSINETTPAKFFFFPLGNTIFYISLYVWISWEEGLSETKCEEDSSAVSINNAHLLCNGATRWVTDGQTTRKANYVSSFDYSETNLLTGVTGKSYEHHHSKKLVAENGSYTLKINCTHVLRIRWFSLCI
jgi:hypothetical protein